MTTTSITAARLRRTLAGAPLDEHYQLEAALAWHQLRPTGRLTAARPAGPPLLSVPETDREEVAARLARLLHSLAWATVTRAPGHGRPVRNPLPTLMFDLMSQCLLHRGQSRPGQVDSPKSAACVLVHARHDEMDVVMGRVAVNRRDPAEAASLGFALEPIDRGGREQAKVEALRTLRRYDQSVDGPAPVTWLAVAAAKELRSRFVE